MKKDCLTIHERLDLLEEENVLLKGDIEDLQADNEHLRQRLDQSQEATYLLEGDIADGEEKILRLEAYSVLAKYKLKSLDGAVRNAQRVAIKATETADGIEMLMQRIKES